jgi:hypothetical protein
MFRGRGRNGGEAAPSPTWTACPYPKREQSSGATLLMLVNDGTFNASKDKHRELLRTDDTVFELADTDAGLVELAQVQLAYREVGHSNPWYASSLAHRFGRLGEGASRAAACSLRAAVAVPRRLDIWNGKVDSRRRETFREGSEGTGVWQ